MIFRTIFFLMSLMLFTACETVDEPAIESVPLVVEGWIEEGRVPVVTVAHAIELKDGKLDSDNYVEKWCRVSVFDGSERYLLTGKIDRDYTISFVYTSSRLRGKAGHTYRLLVESENDTVEAFATINPAVHIESLKAENVGESSGSYLLKLFLNGVDPEGFYKIFTQVEGKDKVFHGSFLGTFSGRDYDAVKGLTVANGNNSTYSQDEFTHYFLPGDKVRVKVCSLDREVYDFWKAYDSSVSMSGNLFFTFAQNCPTNIEGGLGYWGAYGTSLAAITIPETVR